VAELTRQRPDTVGLLDADPELGRYLSYEERQIVRQIPIPVQSLDRRQSGFEVRLRQTGVFAALVLEGMLVRRYYVGEQRSLRMVGPGDLITLAGERGSDLLVCGALETSTRVRLGLLGNRMLLSARRFPRLIEGLQARAALQNERVTAQMVICQMPRVEDRILAILWLLAESWGRVTGSGTLLPVSLTHDLLGELVGARRSTVTLAVRDLIDSGAVLRQNDGWLLLRSLTTPQEPVSLPAHPELHKLRTRSAWSSQSGGPVFAELARPVRPPLDSTPLYAALRSLRADHERNTRRMAESLEVVKEARKRNRTLREQIATQRAATGPPLPPS
jgi:CRP/FNR family cyclic AMP-dependent transcriptional regulator